MHPPRLWPGARLVAAWVLGLAALGGLRRVLAVGTHRVAFGEGHIRVVGGWWSADFAAFMTGFGAALLGIALTAATLSWRAGRRDRAVLRSSRASPHRRILM